MSDMNKVRKAIIPAAGLGTRFLPQTKAMPKEMLPIIDKPVIQIVVEELVAVGVTDIIIVTGQAKRAIEDHFDRSVGLEKDLADAGKDSLAKEIRDIAELANFVYVRQKGLPFGTARPLINASHLLGDEPFFVLFPDDFFRTPGPSRARQMLEAYERTGKSILSLIDVPKADADKYGMAKVADALDENTMRITGLIEKPGAKKTPSTLASVGGYLLTPDIIPIVNGLKPGYGGELVVTDAINQLAQKDEVYGRRIEGVYHDAGNKERYLEAIVDAALAHPKLAPKFRSYLTRRLADD